MRLLFQNIFSVFSEILKYTVMKNFKIVDFWISVVLIIGCTFFVLLSDEEWGAALVISYFIVGGWQVVSMTVHAVKGYFTKKAGSRLLYHWIVVSVVILFPLTMWILIYIAPVMAIFYTWLCYHETFLMMKRPMELLK